MKFAGSINDKVTCSLYRTSVVKEDLINFFNVKCSNQAYCNEITGTVSYATPRLNTFWRYAKVELAPPTPAEFPAVQQGFQNLIKSAQTGKWKTVPVKVYRCSELE